MSSSDIPSDVEEAAQIALSSVIPKKSKSKYDLAYEKFDKWLQEKKINHINEKVLLAYFQGKKELKSSTLWTLYSMLRTEISLKRNVDIKKYFGLVAFLKRKSDGYQPKKSGVLSKDHISRFFKEADDDSFLMTKVAMIVGIAGACRKSELTFLLQENVVDERTFFKVNIPNTKTKVIREFAITKGDIDELDFVEIVRKYIRLRPQNVKHNRFFVKYAHGKCGIQPVGINMFGNLPKRIAEFLSLPNPVLFTGHCFRRTSATLLADSGADLSKIKRHGGWKSNAVAEGYVENSIENKKKIATNILGEPADIHNIVSNQMTATNKTLSSGAVTLHSCTNCVINIYN